MKTERQFLYLDGAAGYTIALDQSALRVDRNGEASRLIPVRRVDRVILRQPRSATLKAILELVRHGASVHLQDGDGRITAAVVSADTTTSPWAQEWALLLHRHVDAEAYADWLDLQLRHGASLIFRRNPSGPITRVEVLLRAYAQRHQRPAAFRVLVDEIDSLLHAWLDAELRRQTLWPVVEALHTKGLDWPADLRRCLWLGLMWRLAPWLRESNTRGTSTRIEFFEQTGPERARVLLRHIAALEHHLKTAAAVYVNGNAGTRRGRT